MSTGDRIRMLRTQLGLSQTELALEINVSKQNLYKYEKGIITNIPSDKIECLATALQTTPAYLMGWTDDPIDYDNMDYSVSNDIADMLDNDPEKIAAFREALDHDQALPYDYETDHGQSFLADKDKKSKSADDKLAENVVIYSRNGETIRKTLTKEEMKIVSTMLDSLKGTQYNDDL